MLQYGARFPKLRQQTGPRHPHVDGFLSPPSERKVPIEHPYVHLAPLHTAVVDVGATLSTLPLPLGLSVHQDLCL